MPHSLTDLADLKVSTEDFLAAVLETTAQPIWVVDHNGMIRFANPAALATLGYDEADELVGRQSHETIHYKHPDGTPYPAAECPMLVPRTTGETVARDLDWFFRRDGSMFPVSYVSAPIAMPQGRGAVVAFTDIQDRRRAQQVLREHDALLAEQQASLRRVAALVARGTATAEVFTAIAREVAQLLRMTIVNIWRFERDGTGTVLGAWSERSHPLEPGTNWSIETPSSAAYVQRTKLGRAVRIDDFAEVAGPVTDALRESGIRSSAAAPIVVGGEIWGVIATGAADHEPLPDEIEDRLADFTELLATSIASAESRAGLARLAEEQASLRRVATLVAKESPPAEVFAKVVEEVANVLGEGECSLVRDEGDGTVSVVASWGAGMSAGFPVGTRLPVDGDGVTASVFRNDRPCGIDDYSPATGAIGERAHEQGIGSVVGCPIRVRGRIWGVIGVARHEARAFPPDTETRMAQFSELVATAIANAAARAEVERLAEEQAALRRVATLVAEGASPTAVFDAVAAEMEALLDADQLALGRYEPGAEVTVVAYRGPSARRTPGGTRMSLAGDSVMATIRRTEQPARVEFAEQARGAIAEFARSIGVHIAVGAPIVVDGRLWGAVQASWIGEEPPAPDTEERMAHFAQLLDSAIANADSRDQLRASRARLLTAGDEARRRVVRDLHDGAQQRQVTAIMMLKRAQQALREKDGDAESLVGEALEYAQQGHAELRELAQGILPAALLHGGVKAGVDTVVARLDLPVHVDVPAERFPAEIEASAYFIVAEALTNVVKHAHAEHATVTAHVENGILRVQVCDDGIGGAQPDGSGLLGLADRLAALNGQLRVESPADGGTLVAADIPI